MRKKRRFWEEEKGKRSISLFIARVQPIIYSIYLFLKRRFWEEEKGKRNISIFIARVQPIIYFIYLFLLFYKKNSILFPIK